MNRKILIIALAALIVSAASFLVYNESEDADGVSTFTIRVGVTDTGCSITVSSPGQSSQTVTAIDYVTMTINQGSSITLTGTAGTGYAFEHWRNVEDQSILSTNQTYTFTPTGDMIISGDFDYLTGYVVSLKVPSTDTGCTATVSSGGSSQTATTDQWVRMSIASGASVTLTSSAGTGYTFGKWVNEDTSATISSNPSYTFTPTGDMEIAADFDPVSCDITFVVSPNNYGTVTVYGSLTDVPYGTPYSIIGDMFWTSVFNYALAEPRSDYGGYRYSFDSWSIPDETEGTITGDMTVTAYFTRSPIATVTLTVPAEYTGCSAAIQATGQSSRTVSAGNSITYTFPAGSTVNLGATRGSEFAFSKWTDGNDNLLSSSNPYSTSSLTNGMTIVAVFDPDSISTVFYRNYSSSDATIVEIKAQSVGQTFVLPSNPTRPGYSFIGWWDARTGGNQITSSTTVTSLSPTSIYAHWSLAQYTLTFNPNGGTVNPSSSSVSYLSEYGSGSGGWPTPARTGYTFAGWYTDALGGDKVESTTQYTATTNTTIYAHWNAAQYTLTFNPNGGTVNPSSSSVSYLSEYGSGSGGWPTPGRTGYAFAGWYSASSGGYRIESTDTYVDTSNRTIYAHWNALITLSVSSMYMGCSATISSGGSSHTVSAGNSYLMQYPEGSSVTLTASEATGYTFQRWYSNLGDLSTNRTYTFTPSSTGMTVAPIFDAPPVDGVFWSNDNYNGSVSLLFKFDASDNKSHQISTELLTGTVAEDQTTTWTDSGYDLTVDISYPALIVTATLTNGQENISKIVNAGSWSTFILTLDSDKGTVTVTPIRTFESFTDYTVYDKQTRTVMDFSDEISGAAILTIKHTESDEGTNSPRFSVVGTSVFLNTFGIVLYNPTINLEDYFPQYESIRVNFYSFALYGESITINGQTWPVDGSKITVQYVSDGSDHYLPGVMPNATVQTRTFELSNIYVTYQDGHCYLTFVNDRFTIDLGAYTPGNETISMQGLWYFATMVYEPYTAIEKHLSDWKILPETDKSQMVLLFLAILVLAGAAVAIHARRSGLGIVDLVIIGAALIFGLVLLG